MIASLFQDKNDRYSMHPAKIDIDRLVTLKYPPNKPIDLLPIMNNKLL